VQDSNFSSDKVENRRQKGGKFATFYSGSELLLEKIIGSFEKEFHCPVGKSCLLLSMARCIIKSKKNLVVCLVVT